MAPVTYHREPAVWLFTDEIQERYADPRKSFWRCPRRLAGTLVDGRWEPGTLARIWRAEGTSRGGGAASSILPILAFHSFPGKQSGDLQATWTQWTSISYRQLAALTGLDKNTVGTAFQLLRDEKLAETKRESSPHGEAPFRWSYRLKVEELFGAGDDSVPFPAQVFYGGAWSILPTSASRHLYLVLTCLDPIGDEDGYLRRISPDSDWAAHAVDEDYRRHPEFRRLYGENGYAEWLLTIPQRLLGKSRAASATSLSDLSTLTGMSRRSVSEALEILTRPLFAGEPGTRPSLALIQKGDAPPRSPTWYAPNRRAWTERVPESVLNDPTAVEAFRAEKWRDLKNRRREAIAKKRARQKERKFGNVEG